MDDKIKFLEVLSQFLEFDKILEILEIVSQKVHNGEISEGQLNCELIVLPP